MAAAIPTTAPNCSPELLKSTLSLTMSLCDLNSWDVEQIQKSTYYNKIKTLKNRALCQTCEIHSCFYTQWMSQQPTAGYIAASGAQARCPSSICVDLNSDKSAMDVIYCMLIWVPPWYHCQSLSTNKLVHSPVHYKMSFEGLILRILKHNTHTSYSIHPAAIWQKP